MATPPVAAPERPGILYQPTMAIHDDYARITPYELAFPDLAYAEERLVAVEEEARARDEEEALADPGRFVMLAEAGRTLQEIRGREEDPALIQQYGVLLYHAYHFWKSGRPVYLLGTHAARYLVEAGPEPGEWSPSVPRPGAYVQLPRHLFWARTLEEGPVEPLDGFFWSLPEEGDLSVLVALGIRSDRPGLSVVPLPTVPLEGAAEWSTTQVREEGEDFETTLPGGELERLYSVETAGEVLKLVARVLWYMDTAPGAVGHEEPGAGDGGAGDAEGEPAPTSLPSRRIGLESRTGSEE